MANPFKVNTNKPNLNNKPVSLVDALNKQGLNLRVAETDQHALADTLLKQAETVRANAGTAAKQAKAVEEAVAILDAAGVSF